MSIVLRVDDLEVGMYITVLNGEKRNTVLGNPQSVDTDLIQLEEEREYGKGDCLKIEAIDLPYMITSNAKIPVLNNYTWDTRLTEFKKLSDNFVKELMK